MHLFGRHLLNMDTKNRKNNHLCRINWASGRLGRDGEGHLRLAEQLIHLAPQRPPIRFRVQMVLVGVYWFYLGLYWFSLVLLSYIDISICLIGFLLCLYWYDWLYVGFKSQLKKAYWFYNLYASSRTT